MEDTMMAQMVLIFMSSTFAELYASRVEKYLVGEIFNGCFYATTADAFVDITRNSAGKWSVLLVDAPTAGEHVQLLNDFIKANPGIAVGIECETERPHALEGAQAFARPVEIDEWLGMMHALDTASRKTR